MNKCKVHLQAVGDESSTFGTSSIGGDNDSFPEAGDVGLDVVLDEGLAVEVIDRDIKETLVLGIVEVHGDDVVGSGAGDEVSNKSTSLSNPLLVAGLGLESIDVVGVLIVVGGITPHR